MSAWLKNAVEEVLWWWVGRPTSKMRREWEEAAAKLPDHPEPGKTWV